MFFFLFFYLDPMASCTPVSWFFFKLQSVSTLQIQRCFQLWMLVLFLKEKRSFSSCSLHTHTRRPERLLNLFITRRPVNVIWMWATSHQAYLNLLCALQSVEEGSDFMETDEGWQFWIELKCPFMFRSVATFNLSISHFRPLPCWSVCLVHFLSLSS